MQTSQICARGRPGMALIYKQNFRSTAALAVVKRVILETGSGLIWRRKTEKRDSKARNVRDGTMNETSMIYCEMVLRLFLHCTVFFLLVHWKLSFWLQVVSQTLPTLAMPPTPAQRWQLRTRSYRIWIINPYIVCTFIPSAVSFERAQSMQLD